MKHLLQPIIGSICCIFLLSSSAKADEIIQNFVLSGYTINTNGSFLTNAANIPLNLMKFDPSLGELQSVSLIVSGSAYDNWIMSPILGGATETIGIYLTGTSPFTSNNYFDIGYHNINIPFSVYTTENSYSELSYLTGNGLTNWSIMWESEGYMTEKLTLNANFSLTYNYAPTSVPEPGSFGLLVFGLMGLCVVRHRQLRGFSLHYV